MLQITQEMAISLSLLAKQMTEMMQAMKVMEAGGVEMAMETVVEMMQMVARVTVAVETMMDAMAMEMTMKE
jgi:hypothetical protein